ncbi:TlpA disulfide reductase family protein [Saccharospirillum alexandrii]|uniref:TlpA family protein disulfide reductase n=1 Tax=Saccharospirillum alexandrii TaxID=2448477 RepID=UPI001FE55F6E|nr:TlpA disulfide reductase family protein [Saccharospirillum alexandrii]
MMTLVLVATLLPLSTVAEPPARTGPGGLLLWETPQDIAAVTFEDGSGNALSLSDFSGKYVLLNLWATWCGPCREEMPTLDALQSELGGSNFDVLALSLDRQGAGVVTEFYREIGIENLGVYVDDSGMAGNKLRAVGIPTTLLLNTEGQEIGRLVGTAEWNSDEMIKFLADILS